MIIVNVHVNQQMMQIIVNITYKLNDNKIWFDLKPHEVHGTSMKTTTIKDCAQIIRIMICKPDLKS